MSLRSRVPVVVLALLLLATGCSSDGSDASSVSAKASAGAVNTLVQSGLTALTSGDADTAKAAFENVLTLDPDNLYAHYNLGVIAQQRGNDEQAITSFDAALAVDGDYAPALYNRAILTEPTDLDQAIEIYRKAVAADPTMAAAFMRLGFALVHLGQDEEGATYLQEGIQLDPTMENVQAPSYD